MKGSFIPWDSLFKMRVDLSGLSILADHLWWENMPRCWVDLQALLLLLELIVLFKSYIKQVCPSLNSLSWLFSVNFAIKETLCVLLGGCVGSLHWCHNASMDGFMIVHQLGPMAHVTWVWSPWYHAQTFHLVRFTTFGTRLHWVSLLMPAPEICIFLCFSLVAAIALAGHCEHGAVKSVNVLFIQVLYPNPTLICYTFEINCLSWIIHTV